MRLDHKGYETAIKAGELPTHEGEYAVYKNTARGITFHIERIGIAALFGVKNVSEGMTYAPRDRTQLALLFARHDLRFISIVQA